MSFEGASPPRSAVDVLGEGPGETWALSASNAPVDRGATLRWAASKIKRISTCEISSSLQPSGGFFGCHSTFRGESRTPRRDRSCHWSGNGHRDGGRRERRQTGDALPIDNSGRDAPAAPGVELTARSDTGDVDERGDSGTR